MASLLRRGKAMLFYFPAHTLDSSEQDRRQRKELIFSLIFKKTLVSTRVFLCHFTGEDVGNNQNIFESLDDRNKRS
ncbi:MAG: hypothetical protein RIQ74_2231 [Pseudomonadota bacterium]